MVAIMVVIGGVTRLTHSGLSIVEWKPISGVLPPLSETEWQEAFTQYQQFPEYQRLNRDMTLEGFKGIFWLEFIHRLWGRILGLVFIVPFLWFLVRGRIDRRLARRLAAVFLLGAAQGVLGWYMVQSGLVDRPDVSPYRLSAHLLLAFLLYGYLFRLGLRRLIPGPRIDTAAGLRAGLGCLAALLFLTIASGGLVAGLDAGFAYNTFPLMAGQIVPEGLWLMEPIARNLFENLVTVQFQHRLLAILCCAFALALWAFSYRSRLGDRARLAMHATAASALLQVGLGIATLVLVVPIAWAAAHQAGALLLFTITLYAHFALRRP